MTVEQYRGRLLFKIYVIHQIKFTSLSYPIRGTNSVLWQPIQRAYQKPHCKNIARKQLETTKQVYLISLESMFSEYKGERENVKNYNGRQLLEMLQNADDASMAAPENNRKVLIWLQENALVIANNGYPFSEEGLNSIFLSHLSPKDVMEQQIGKKVWDPAPSSAGQKSL